MKLFLCNIQHKSTYVSLFRRSHLRPAILLKKRLWPRCFPVNFLKFLRTTFFTEHVWTTASVCFIYFEVFKQFRSIFFGKLFEIFNMSGISDKYVLHFNFIIICKKQRLQHDSNNSNTSSYNSESETELPDFSTLKLFDMEPKKSFITAAVNVVGFVNRLKQTEAAVSNVLQNIFLKMVLKKVFNFYSILFPSRNSTIRRLLWQITLVAGKFSSIKDYWSQLTSTSQNIITLRKHQNLTL